MTVAQSIFLGLLQGLTEFLPVSSTAHLVAAQSWLRLQTIPVEFDVIVHLATALATMLIFWPEIIKIKRRMIWFIVLAMIPTGVIGLWLNRWNELIFGSLIFSAVTLIINGLILLLPQLIKARKSNLNNQSALIIGLAQGVAVLPGISRSGATIVSGLLLGLKPADAYNFSFLISLPAILAAQGLQINKAALTEAELMPGLAGFITAFIAGWLALLWLRRIVSRGRFTGFAVYCLVLGVLLLVL
jgi:undecaprenyl-diphosphatase